jgi:hypothetical protein
MKSASARTHDGDMSDKEDQEAARALVAHANVVIRLPARKRLWIRKLLVRHRSGNQASLPEMFWRDAPSQNRLGWRERAAYLNGSEVFAVDYQVCQDCKLGWVEEPATDERYLRCGLASAGLAALRAEHPGLEWHMLGGHLTDAVPFWRSVDAGVSGGYTKRAVCSHGTIGG